MDTHGAWNGSAFTITVSDQEPHFLYSISLASPWTHNCSTLVEYQSRFTIPPESDVIFALNPV